MAEHDAELRQGAKAAAAAAAVGAAVGVARAIASRAEDAAHDREDHADRDDRSGRDDRDRDEEREDEREPARAGHEPRDEGDDRDDHTERDEDDERREPERGAGVGRLRRLTRNARELLEELSGAEVEAVSGVDRTRDGWRITLEAVELRRIPDSTDVLASYVVELDDDGDLVRYERGRRYARGQSERGDDL